MPLSQEERSILMTMKGYITKRITNCYDGLECMILCRDQIMHICWDIIGIMRNVHNVDSFKCINILYEAYDQPKNTKSEKLIYCFFYIAYCAFLVDTGDVRKPDTTGGGSEGKPGIIILKRSSPPTPTPPVEPVKSPPVVLPDKDSPSPQPSNQDYLDELNEKIKGLEETIDELKGHSRKIQSWDDIYNMIRKHSSNP